VILWVVAGLLTAAAVGLMLHALLRPTSLRQEGADRAIFRDQLAEVERDRARGAIAPAEAQAARAEIARRLLAAERAAGPAPAPRTGGTRALALAVSVLVPVAALAIYLPTGRPDLPGQPLAERDTTAQQAQAAATAEAVALRARLDAASDDRDGWIELGRRWMQLGDAARAADAWGRAIGLSPEGDPLLESSWAEATIFANEGVVTETATRALERVLAARPDDARARYYLAVGRAQAGDDQAALAGWQDLMRTSPADAPWVASVRERIAEVARRLGLDPARATPEPLAPTAGPDSEAGAAIASLPPEQQEAAIRAMVDGLEARLVGSPDDLEGWLRLARARQILGEPAKAADAFARAASLAPDESAILSGWADARLAAGEGDTVPPAFEAAMRRLAAQAPDNPQALWFLGVAAARDRNAGEAARLWGALAAQFAEGSPEKAAIEARIASLPTN
jgi:cytochrome c-type biogenesis protein CcmH